MEEILRWNCSMAGAEVSVLSGTGRLQREQIVLTTQIAHPPGGKRVRSFPDFVQLDYSTILKADDEGATGHTEDTTAWEDASSFVT